MVGGLVEEEEVVVVVLGLLLLAELMAAVLLEAVGAEAEAVPYWEHIKLRLGLAEMRVIMRMEVVALGVAHVAIAGQAGLLRSA